MRIGMIVSLVASMVLGLAALFVARVMLPKAGEGGKDGVQAVAADTVPVVAAKADIVFGTKLEAGKLVVVRLPRDAVPVGAYSSIEQVLGQPGGAPVALTRIAARETLLPAKLSGAGARASVASLIAPGMRAYTIGVTDVAGVGGHALPGDRVDVLLSREVTGGGYVPEGSSGSARSEVVIQNVRVLAVNLNADPVSTDKASPDTATLEVGLEDAERLALAVKIGDLSLALRRTGAADTETARPMRVSDVGGGVGAPPLSAPAPRRAVARPATRVAQAPASRTSSLVIVHGDERANVSVREDRS